MHCYGFPLERRSEYLIRTILMTGEVIEADDQNLKRVNCSILKLLIEVEVCNPIPSEVFVSIGDAKFRV